MPFVFADEQEINNEDEIGRNEKIMSAQVGEEQHDAVGSFVYILPQEMVHGLVKFIIADNKYAAHQVNKADQRQVKQGSNDHHLDAEQRQQRP